MGDESNNMTAKPSVVLSIKYDESGVIQLVKAVVCNGIMQLLLPSA